MRSLLITACSLAMTTFAVVSAQGCGSDSDPGSGSSSSGGDGDGGPCVGFGCNENEGGPSGCVGLECNQAACEGATKTTLTGKVFDPAGKVPLYNVVVYVPNGTPEPIISGLGPKCDTCAGSVTGNPIALALTDASGSFTLENVPADVDFPLVVQIGKWRRTITIPKVAPCTTVALDAGTIRLPRNRTEGDIPRIALATGAADPLECLLRKIGLDDSEFGTAGSEARIHLYAGGGTTSPPTTATSSFQAGGDFAPATGLWGSLDELKKYDIVMLSCEGTENPDSKPDAARQALYDYSAVGGRVFTSHYHHYWFSRSPVASVKGLAEWTNDFTCKDASCPRELEPNPATTVFGTINTSFAKGAAMKDWLRNTSSLTGPEETLPIQEGRHNVNAVTAGAISWITMANPAASGKIAHEYITFNTPVGAPDEQVCGRVVFTDLHVGAGDATGTPFPSGCTTPDLTPQQKALEFMLFDLSSCIQRDDKPPVLPK
jgi:hypothetical protein